MPKWTGKAAVAVLTVAAAGWGGWQFFPDGRPASAAPNVVMRQAAAVPRLASVAVLPPSATASNHPAHALPTEERAPEATKAAPTAAARSVTTTPTAPAPQQSRPTRNASSTDLVTARATTWVNVRAEANTKSAIVGMILPDSIVELGESRGHWRRVSTRWYSGWASARLFAVDSVSR